MKENNNFYTDEDFENTAYRIFRNYPNPNEYIEPVRTAMLYYAELGNYNPTDAQMKEFSLIIRNVENSLNNNII